MATLTRNLTELASRINGDLKHHVASRTNPTNKAALADEARTHLRRRQNQPKAIQALFGKEEVRYAAH